MDAQVPASPAVIDAEAYDVSQDAQGVPVIDRLLTRREVEILTSLSKQKIYRKIAEGTFPKPVVICEDRRGRATRVGWSAIEVQTWRLSRPRRVGVGLLTVATPEMRAA